jgi:hypothetical protein
MRDLPFPTPTEEALRHEEDVAEYWFERCQALQSEVTALQSLLLSSLDRMSALCCRVGQITAELRRI